jgi:tripartite-type tricarboxylate transporter receptor subunit TctC
MVPAGTPRPVIDRLHGAFAQALAMPDVQKAMTDVGLVPTTSAPDEFAARIRTDIDKFSRIVKASGIKVD